jgi:peptidoglycan/xylan/chitin deacetylase (PgdA/CDA1 family)
MTTFASAAKQTLAMVGAYRMLLAAAPFCGVAVLAYHGLRDDRWRRGTMRFEPLHVAAATFAAHCSVLRTLGCAMLSLADWREIAAGLRPVPPRAVMLTFDDGYRTVLTHAVPVLERHRIPATLFACTTPIERQIRFWFDAVAERHGEGAVEQAKTLPHGQWRDLVAANEMAAADDDPHAPLTIDELRSVAAHDLIGIGTHTATHPILARASIEVQREEIAQSRRALESWLERPVTSLAYPNGRPGIDLTDDTVAAARAAGIEHAFSTQQGFAVPTRERYGYPRWLMLDSVSAPELAHRLAVSWRRLEGRPS